VYTVAQLDSATRRIEDFRPTAAKKQSCRPIFMTLARRAACNESNKLPMQVFGIVLRIRVRVTQR